MTTVRQAFVSNCRWAVAHKDLIHYTMGPLRNEAQHKPFVLPMWADCSMFLSDMAEWAHSTVDPLGEHFSGIGYTGTEVAACTPITLAQCLPGDLVVYGPGNGDHTAAIVDMSNPRDPLTVSHGQESDPSYVHVSQDGRPVRYFRFLPVDPPVVAARPNPTDHPFIAAHPGGGQAIIHPAAHQWMGFPSPAAYNAAIAKHTIPFATQPVPASFWRAAKQIPFVAP